jgi:hypothetical protein
MKKLYSFLGLSLISLSAFSQTTFWTEDFGTGCNRAQVASMYTGSNGQWQTTGGLIAGGNDQYANQFFISATVGGNGVGNCADNCITASTATSRSLHISNPTFTTPFGGVMADTGCTYLTGAFSIIGINSTTNTLATSPTINCTGRSTIGVRFEYIEGGDNTLDNASFAYSADGGVTWTIIDDMPKTGIGTCPGLSGPWTTYQVNLPASANNNANVKIGFNWTNNNDGNGADPSFAVDNIAITEGVLGTNSSISIEPLIFNTGKTVTVQTNGATVNLLSVTDMTGRLINAQLVNGTMELPETSGIYFVTFEINGVRTVRKFMVN